MKYVGYLRVSTVGQVADGYGLELQEEAIRTRLLPGHRRLKLYRDEGVSGRLLDRPALLDALRALEYGDVFIVARLDRLARDVVSQELLIAEIRRAGAKLVSCADGEQAYLEDDPDDPSRKFIRVILGAVSEYERAMTVMRLRGGRRAKRQRGEFGGGEAPFGYRVRQTGGLEPDAREQAVLRFIHEHRAQGVTLEEIAVALNGVRSLHPRRGKRWNKTSVHRMLRRKPLEIGDDGRLRLVMFPS